MKNLDVDFSEYLGDLKGIYELYNPVDYIKEAELLLDAKTSNEDEDAPSLEGLTTGEASSEKRLDAVWRFLGLRKSES